MFKTNEIDKKKSPNTSTYPVSSIMKTDDDDINSQWNPEEDRDKIDFTHFHFNPTTI